MKITKQYVQDDYPLNFGEFPETWRCETHGCGYTSLANCLYNLGFDVDPIATAKMIFLDKDGNFDATYLVGNGTRYEGIIYALDRYINEMKFPIEYYRMIVNFDHPEDQRKELEDNLKNGYLAIIQIGPEDIPGQAPRGHYSVISDVDDEGNFYIIDSDKNMAHTHMTTPFKYEFILKSLYGKRDKLNILFVRVIPVLD